ncbi:nucleotidyltransferase family protein [uncultured Methanobacterium sp.]|uniref:nucleotidyltransferase domain-containing protein n=1 Tax=uncultured Methanobacterium sp. TaxID=176306 RepID=UPI002AA65830|nr:nucleotidyltransferase family protein [uncultured Methanobacterium sp.]
MDPTFKLKKEDQLLLSCARIQMDDENKRKIKNLVKLDLDWDYLLKITSKHKLQQIVYWQLNQICADEVPSEYIQNFKQFLKNNSRKNLFFTKELINIIQSLNVNNIKSIPYKGPVLAQQVYGNIVMRQFGDIDFFVKKENVLSIKEILISKGYKPEFDLDSAQEQNYLDSQRELKFFHEDKGISLELHWKFSGIFLNLSSNAEKLFLKDQNSLSLGGVTLPKLSPENLILILSIHNASHHWSRLAWLVDIATLINNQKIDWKRVLKISEELSIQRILFINLYLCQVLLNLKLENDISQLLSSNSVITISNTFADNIFSFKEENSLIENMQISMKIRENKIDGIKDGLSGIFNPSFYELNHLVLPSSLFFLYYIYRPINLLKRYKIFK